MKTPRNFFFFFIISGIFFFCCLQAKLCKKANCKKKKIKIYKDKKLFFCCTLFLFFLFFQASFLLLFLRLTQCPLQTLPLKYDKALFIIKIVVRGGLSCARTFRDIANFLTTNLNEYILWHLFILLSPSPHDIETKWEESLVLYRNVSMVILRITSI